MSFLKNEFFRSMANYYNAAEQRDMGSRQGYAADMAGLGSNTIIIAGQHGWQRPLGRQRFVEGLWKSVKYKEVYLHAYDTVSQARQGLESYFKFYNERRPHSSLDGKTPDAAYVNSLPLQHAA